MSTDFRTLNPGIEAQVRDGFARQALMSTLGACQAEVWGEGETGRELEAVMLSTIVVRPK